MFYRKLYVAFYTSILAVVTLYIIEPISNVDGGIMTAILAYGSFVVPIIYIYGVLTSMIAEQISVKVHKMNESMAFGIHLLFGSAFVVFYHLIFDPQTLFQLSLKEILIDPLTLFGGLFSIVFYCIDRLMNLP